MQYLTNIINNVKDNYYDIKEQNKKLIDENEKINKELINIKQEKEILINIKDTLIKKLIDENEKSNKELINIKDKLIDEKSNKELINIKIRFSLVNIEQENIKIN